MLTPFAPPQSTAMKSKTITVAALGILLGGLGYGGDAKGQEPAVEGNPGLENTVTNKLKEAPGWTQEAANAYWKVNMRRLTVTNPLAPDLVEKETKLLWEIHPAPKVVSLLENHPEASGLLLLAFKKEPLAEAIMDAPVGDQTMLVASYLFCTTHTEVDEWTAAVKRHPKIISLLQKKCAALPYQGIFAYLDTMKSPEARDIYGKWLDEVMAPDVISASDETLSSRLNFVGYSGMDLRKKLDDPGFRPNFLGKIWPRFRDSMVQLSQMNAEKSDVYYLCGSEPQIWEFFKREDSQKLFVNAGMDAVTMLMGNDALHLDVQAVVAALWAGGVLDLPRLIHHYDGDESFRKLVKLLGDKVNWGLLNAVILRLEEKGNQWPQEAKYLSGLALPALNAELHPQEPGVIPGAGFVNLVRKALDGRRIDGGDWIAAGFDAMDIVTIGVILVTDGAAAPLLAEEKALQQTLKTTVEVSVQKLAKGAGRKAPKAEWPQVLAKKAMEQLPKACTDTIERFGMVDITKPVMAGFNISKRLGFDRESFKKLTGLEARVFMRKDGLVFINFTNGLETSRPAAYFLTRTLENKAVQAVPVKKVIKGAKEVLPQWKEDVSAWWSGHATGQFNEPQRLGQ